MRLDPHIQPRTSSRCVPQAGRTSGRAGRDAYTGSTAGSHGESATRAGSRTPFDEDPTKPRDPHWYKRAVFYEVLIRGFYDSNGDGTGDMRGLIEKLDYLQWLGVDCIWLLPIYESPLRDGGYDISDFMKILPEFGDSGTSSSWWTRRTSAACGSSPTW